MMPRLDGLEVCRQLKADPDTSDIVVVMLTAQAQERDRDQGLAAGADDYFTKPFSPLALLNMVERVRHNQSGRRLSEGAGSAGPSDGPTGWPHRPGRPRRRCGWRSAPRPGGRSRWGRPPR